MKCTDGFLTWGLLAVGALLACSFAPVWAADLSPDELAAQVLIRRDTYGVPHILADTEEAAAFGYGYAAAEDHVLEIARLYLAARAEEAAYFGEQFAESDFMMKQFRIWEVAAEGYGKSPPAVRSVLDGYAAGYNRYLDKHRSELPDWVKPVTGIDVLSHGRRDLILGFCMNLGQIARIGRTASAKRVEEDPAANGAKETLP